MAAGDATHAPPAAEMQTMVAWFCGLTLMNPADAYFFLEDHNWAFESALSSFYDSTEVDADGPDPAPQPPPPAADDGADSEDEVYVGGGDKDEDDEDYVGGGEGEDEDAALAAAFAAVDERRRTRPAKRQKSSHQARGGSGSGGASGRGTVRTLSDLGGGKRGAGSDGDEDSDDDGWAPPPELYTGGDKSGMVVRDRSKRKIVADDVFKQAKRKGAKPGPARWQSSSSSSRLLTGDTVQSDAPQPPEEIVHIYFWSNGFTVDDGPLRSFDDPEHASLLKSIKNSQCPTELAPADGRSKVNVNLVRKEEKCPVPVKCPAPFQGGGRTAAAAHLASKQAMAATFPDHPGELALVDLLRRWIQGDTKPWIHEASPYGSDPVALTAKYPQATSEKGDLAWYFVCIPRKKEGSDARISRTAGAGTWKEDRTMPVQVLRGGARLRVGWKQSFAFVLKTKTTGQKKDTITRLGWLMLAISLNKGEDSDGRCLCKVYPTPRKNKKGSPLIPLLSVLAPAPVMNAAAATATTAGSAIATTAAASAIPAATTSTPQAAATAATTATTAAASASAAAAATTLGSAIATTTAASAIPAVTASTPQAAATAATTATTAAASASAAAATTVGSAIATTATSAIPAATSSTPQAAATTAAAAASAAASPPKKWIQVQVSASPTKSSHRPKRVYQMMDLPEQEGVSDLSNKRMRILDCKGWLTIEPPYGSENQQVS